jgi:hypothetical protein
MGVLTVGSNLGQRLISTSVFQGSIGIQIALDRDVVGVDGLAYYPKERLEDQLMLVEMEVILPKSREHFPLFIKLCVEKTGKNGAFRRLIED